MQIVLNGQIIQVVDQCSITKMLETLALKNQRVAVEVNQEVIPRAQHNSFALSSGDKVEVIQAVGGG
ncbi:MAG: sulfur carrier protein ThiS [Gammaproteobacteria bacterium]